MEASDRVERAWRTALRRVVDGRPVVCVGGPAAIWRREVDEARRAGATDVSVVAFAGAGAGPSLDATVVEVDLGTTGLDLMASMRAERAAVADPHPGVLSAVRSLDPDRRAILFGTFLEECAELDGRPFLAHRRPSWVALEDKTVIDAFWDRCGVRRAPSEVVALGDAPGAHGRLDRGAGTVWSADARDGWHGGATGTVRVAGSGDAARATERLAGRCDRVRVMPFLPGVPCSIHGVVCAGGVAALRPVEMVTFLVPGGFRYAGCSTVWDPPTEVRQEMRSVASRVGARLRDEVGFRGAFTVDGVVGDDGFVPTELNPRSGAGLSAMGFGIDDLPLLLVIELIKGGHLEELDPADLEAVVLDAADANRGGGTWTHLDVEGGLVDVPLRYDGDGWRFASEDEPADASLSTSDDFVRCRFVTGRWPTGASVSRPSIDFYAFADRELGSSMGPLVSPAGA